MVSSHSGTATCKRAGKSARSASGRRKILSLIHIFKEAVERVETPEAQLASQVIDFCLRRNKEWGYDEANLHDVVAFCALVNPSVLTFKKYYMDVETEGTITRGMTVADFRDVCPDKEKNVWCAEDIDLGRFWRWFVDLFQSYEKK